MQSKLIMTTCSFSAMTGKLLHFAVYHTRPFSITIMGSNFLIRNLLYYAFTDLET